MKTSKLLGLLTLLLIMLTAGDVQSEPPAVFVSDTLVSDGASQKLCKKEIRRKKTIAIGLAITLGPFGVHRLYLGTDYKVPAIYSITLGGFGVLALADIIAILTTQELEHYLNNGQIVMWLK